ncbi:biofilm development regulator YmgB/AriR family protein [Erwinia psidii]|uniref:Two-component-system connector protein AriR n=1 Tax=Erwinia psidii TaxID=69224 RepID=A0A3N6UUV3_9GAMM|nr:biofilm development regulator YmgB/AriR family protein [Erwinia psidii]MCX8957690.1 hypothetical protein [Erwinia psidii]MCX8960745.1 hypothetical protein [Erwinia psidii]MCX8964009.1 hypothetical protein [Erwinia psidii]RQM39729.1 hypothetical protein EB241_03435 [Erwinia psidii]
MVHYDAGAGRAITDYFNSPAFQAPKEVELLAVTMTELMRRGKPATSKAIIARAISRLESDMDNVQLQDYRHLLNQLLQEMPP